MELLAAAIAENARWCTLVSRWHGVEWSEQDGIALAAGPPPPWFPGAVTLRRGLTADAATASRPVAVKDSYGELDLGRLGYVLAFGADWIGRPAAAGSATRWRAVRTPESLGRWRKAHGSADAIVAAALDAPAVAVLELPGEPPPGGAIVHLDEASGVVALSNVFGDVDRAELAAAAQHRFGARPVVGYERGTAFAAARTAGFAALGPLRVWVRSD